jgi:hypothetical protein
MIGGDVSWSPPRYIKINANAFSVSKIGRRACSKRFEVHLGVEDA